MKSLKKKGFVLKRAGEKPKKKKNKQEGKKRSCKRTRKRTFRRRLEKKGTKIFFSRESYMYDYCNSYVHFHLPFLIYAWLVEFC